MTPCFKYFEEGKISVFYKMLQHGPECTSFEGLTNSEIDLEYQNYSIPEDDEELGIKYFEPCAAPLWQQAIDWLREKYKFHIQIIPIPYFNNTKIAYFYNIVGDNEISVYDNQDLYGDVLQASSQDIPGNHLNNELYDKNIFDMKFAYKTYKKCNEQAILKVIEIIKNRNIN